MKKGDRVLWLDLIHIVRTPGKTTPYSTTHCSRSFNHKEVTRMRKASPTCLLCVVNVVAYKGHARSLTQLPMRNRRGKP